MISFKVRMKSIPSFTLVCYFFFLLLNHVFSFAPNTMAPNQFIRDNETLISSGQTFQLGFFSPGNSKNRYLGIWYKRTPETVVWVANRNNPITDHHGILTMKNNGDLVLLNKTNDVIWSSNISEDMEDPEAELLDSGNLVLMDNIRSRMTESYRWQSFDHPSDTLLPGMKLGWNLTSGRERYLTSWRSADDPSIGEYALRVLDIPSLPYVAITAGSTWKFRTSPFYAGRNTMINNELLMPTMERTEEELNYMYAPLSNSRLTRVTLNQSGLVQSFVMNDLNTGWNNLYSNPMDICDNYGQCGANAICRTSRESFCECLTGFKFTSTFQGEYYVHNWAGSTKCKRKHTLDCQRGEGFIKLKRMKLPDLLKFRLKASLDPKQCEAECRKNCSCRAYANLNIKEEAKGCLMWFSDLYDIREQPGTFKGWDIYLRVTASDFEAYKKKRQKTILIVSISSTFGILLFGFILYISWKKFHRRGMKDWKMDLEVPLFDMETIADATENFSENNIIGEGGFGPVYKGKFSTGQEIAVKRLSKNSRQGFEEFMNEVNIIAKLQHRNLVALLGSCIQGDERMLIYEYLPNKSLDHYIFEKNRKSLLDWKKRFNIILGIVRGLLYLHQDSKLQIVHRDLKASNILLDCNLNPKISDFGLARIFCGDEKEEKTNRIVGTYGYISPEYCINGKFSVKSDVYSLGVLILEILSGRRNKDFSHHENYYSLLGHAWLLWTEGRALELMDTVLEDTCDNSQVLRCIHVGLMCVQKLAEDRPAMSSVASMLDNEGYVLPQPKKPGFFMERSSIVDAISHNKENFTSNSVTISLFEAR